MRQGIKCSLPECDEPTAKRGYCTAHLAEVLEVRRLMTECHKVEPKRRKKARPVFRDPRQDHGRHHGGSR